MEGCTIQKLNLLAFPRNFIPICELTGEHATVELVTPHITLYYVSEAAARQSWQGIVKKIAHLLAPLRSDPPIIGTAEERETRAKHILACKRSLIDFCLSESSNFISSHLYDLAIPGATQALKLCKELDGDLSLGVVEPMLQLSQASLGLNQLRQAEEYLALARWIVINAESVSDRILARLHSLMGRVHTAQGNFNDAKEELARGVYFSSRTFGAESVQTSSGYYRLGDIFLAQGLKESALAFFDKVVDIWYKFLLGLMKVADMPMAASVADSSALKDTLSAEDFADGLFQLTQVLRVRESVIGEKHIATGEVLYTLGLFHFLYKNDVDNAIEFTDRAHGVYETSLGSFHQSTVQVARVIQIIQNRGVGEESFERPEEVFTPPAGSLLVAEEA